jgi:hypothetical protein
VDPVEELLQETRRHLSAGRSVQARAKLDEALALVAAAPPSVGYADVLGRYGAGWLPAIARLPTLTRAVAIAWRTGDPTTIRFWTEHLVNAALEAERPDAARPAVAQLLGAAWPSAPERAQAQGWERTITRAAAKADKAAKAGATPKGKPKGAATPKRSTRPAGNVARWLTRMRLRVREIARAEDIDPDALAEVLGHLDGLAADLRALGGDRGADVLDDLEGVEDPQKQLVIAAGETDARARVEGLDATDADTPFLEVRALLEPTEW